MELAVSLLAIEHGQIPPTLNYARPDAECPVNVVRTAPQQSAKPTALVLNQTVSGQAAALILGAP